MFLTVPNRRMLKGALEMLSPGFIISEKLGQRKKFLNNIFTLPIRFFVSRLLAFDAGILSSVNKESDLFKC